MLCRVSDPTTTALRRGDAISNATSVLLAPAPWEVEELFSLQFAQTPYENIFDDIETGVHLGNLRLDDQDRPPIPDGAFEFHIPCKWPASDTSFPSLHHRKKKKKGGGGWGTIKAEVPAQRSRRNFVEGTVLHGSLGLLQTILLDTTPEDKTERLVALM